MPMSDSSESVAGLDGRLLEIFRELLEEERLGAKGADERRQHELRHAIETRETQMADESLLESVFEKYIGSLPTNQRPQNNPQKYRMFAEWESGLRREVASLRSELVRLNDRPVDKQLVFGGAEGRVMSLLRRAAQSVHMLPEVKTRIAELDGKRQKGKDRPFGASKNSATHPEQIKELALSLYSAGNNARQVAEELFANDFGTRAGRMIGPGQMAQMLKRWTAEADMGTRGRSRGQGRTANSKLRERGHLGAGIIRSTATHGAEIMTMANQLRKDGLSFQQISDELWKANYGTKAGTQFGAGQVRDLVVRSLGQAGRTRGQ